jgi:serine/threonine-protein kinase
VKLFRWTLLFVVMVIFASGAVAIYTVFFRNAPTDAPMPSLRDKSVIDAAAEADRLGLAVRLEQVVSSLPEGRVLAQYPDPGVRVRRNQTVILQVSRGGVRRPVPDVRNFDAARAQVVIREQGFEVGDIVYIKDDSRAGGFVIAQSPAAPAHVPGDKKIDLLVSQGGAGADGKAVIPDVAQMTERQARDLLTASGFKIPAVDYVYHPNAIEGEVIGTRPAAGASARIGEGIRLKVATAKRPAGAPEPPAQIPAAAVPPPASVPGQVRVEVPGHGSIVVVEASGQVPRSAGTNANAAEPRPRAAANPALPTAASAPAGQPAAAQPAVVQPAAIQPTAAQPAAGQPTAVQPAVLTPAGKIARIRYQVPPLARPLQLKIEMADPSGTKVLLERSAKSGEYVALDAPYSRECAVTIYLGGEFVWQDRYM